MKLWLILCALATLMILSAVGCPYWARAEVLWAKPKSVTEKPRYSVATGEAFPCKYEEGMDLSKVECRDGVSYQDGKPWVKPGNVGLPLMGVDPKGDFAMAQVDSIGAVYSILTEEQWGKLIVLLTLLNRAQACQLEIEPYDIPYIAPGGRNFIPTHNTR